MSTSQYQILHTSDVPRSYLVPSRVQICFVTVVAGGGAGSAAEIVDGVLNVGSSGGSGGVFHRVPVDVVQSRLFTLRAGLGGTPESDATSSSCSIGDILLECLPGGNAVGNIPGAAGSPGGEAGTVGGSSLPSFPVPDSPPGAGNALGPGGAPATAESPAGKSPVGPNGGGGSGSVSPSEPAGNGARGFVLIEY